MSNSFFRFKEFTVYQDKCAMKVCTDACLFGAWLTERIARYNLNTDSMLDVGSGTGLLSLMLAQRTAATIDAVEIEAGAADQTAANFESSPWKQRLNVFPSDIRFFERDLKYDFLFSNPPFFENGLRSDKLNRNLALHSTALSLEELVKSIRKLLKREGAFGILLPYHRGKYFEELAAENGFCLIEKTDVRQTPSHGFFRSMYLFSEQATTFHFVQSEIIIKTDDNQYTSLFEELLKDYYLFQQKI